MSHLPVADLRATALAAAQAARGETMRYFRTRDLRADNKAQAGFDPVTDADRAAERSIGRVLSERRPNDGILGEEFGARAGDSGLTWVIDPIDGTRAFIAGAPTWGTLIAVSDADGPILGLIDQPHIGETFFGGPGEAWLDGPRGRADLRTADTRALPDAVLMTTFPEVGTSGEASAFRALAGEVRLTRYGLDCYAYGLLALGHVDLVVEAGLNPYDIHAPIAVIEAAGGVVTDWRGGPAHQGGRVVAAANRDLHAAAVAILGEA